MSQSSFKIHSRRSAKATRTNPLYRTGRGQRTVRAVAGKRRGCTYGRAKSGRCKDDPEKRAKRAKKYRAKNRLPLFAGSQFA